MSSVINGTNVMPILLDKLRSMRLHERLAKSVDRDKVWDGTIDLNKVRRFNDDSGSKYICFEYVIQLTFGSLSFYVRTLKADSTVNHVRLSYRINNISTYYSKMLVKNRVDRDWDSDLNGVPMAGLKKLLQSQKSFENGIAIKMNSLLDTVESWADKNYYINSARNIKNAIIPISSTESFNLRHLIDSVTRTKLISQLQADRIEAVGEDASDYKRINQMTHEMLVLLDRQLRTARMNSVATIETW